MYIQIQGNSLKNNHIYSSKNYIQTSSKSDKLTSISYALDYEKINREEKLTKFFEKYKSPLAKHSNTFIKIADLYDFDYRILPSIACQESTCGKFLIPDYYNPFGWGGGYIRFNNYDESISKVGKGLNEIYISKGLTTIELIAPVYNPPNPIGWTKKVKYFMDQI